MECLSGQVTSGDKPDSATKAFLETGLPWPRLVFTFRPLTTNVIKVLEGFMGRVAPRGMVYTSGHAFALLELLFKGAPKHESINQGGNTTHRTNAP